MNLIERVEKVCEANNLESVDYQDLNWESTISLKCKVCGTKFEKSIKQLLDKNAPKDFCSYCRSRKNFEKVLVEKYKTNPYEFLEPVPLKYDELFLVKCKLCESTFKISKKLIGDSRSPFHICQTCVYDRTYRRDVKEFEDYMTEKFGKCNYDILNPHKFGGINTNHKLKFRCRICGHEFETFITNVERPRNGKHYCRVCNHKDRMLERMTYEEKCKLVTDGKLTPLEEYIDSRTPILHRCNVCGHEWLKRPVVSTGRNSGCPNCKKLSQRSKEEKLISDYISSIYSGKIELNRRDLLSENTSRGKEIDIYLPELKIGFEYCGTFWHKFQPDDRLRGNPELHKEKYDLAKEKGILLITIFSDKWRFEKLFVKDMIKGAIKKTDYHYLKDYLDKEEVDVSNEFPNIIRDLEKEGFEVIKENNAVSHNCRYDGAERDKAIYYDCGSTTLKKKD